MPVRTKDFSSTAVANVPEMSTVGVRTRSRRTAVAQPTDPIPAAAAVVPATVVAATVPVGSTIPAAKRRTKTTSAATLAAAGPILEPAPVPNRRVAKSVFSKKGKSTASNKTKVTLQEAVSESDTAGAIDSDVESVKAQTLEEEYEELMRKMFVLVARGQPTKGPQVPPVPVVPAVPQYLLERSRTPEGRRIDLTQGQTLGTYDGTTDLDTFLNKFETMSKICGWAEEVRKFYITTALTDTSAFIVREIGETGTSDVVISRLKIAFGNEQQTERFRAELKRRRRGKGESLRALYLDFCRLKALAFPKGQEDKCPNFFIRDLFLEALGDRVLRKDVLITRPATLEAAYNEACRMELIGLTIRRIRERCPTEHESRSG